MDEELHEFCKEIVRYLVRYGNLDEADAWSRVQEARLCEAESEIDRIVILHEEPYYWAMSILHGRNDPYWWQNPELWPPPEDATNWR